MPFCPTRSLSYLRVSSHHPCGSVASRSPLSRTGCLVSSPPSLPSNHVFRQLPFSCVPACAPFAVSDLPFTWLLRRYVSTDAGGPEEKVKSTPVTTRDPVVRRRSSPAPLLCGLRSLLLRKLLRCIRYVTLLAPPPHPPFPFAVSVALLVRRTAARAHTLHTTAGVSSCGTWYQSVLYHHRLVHCARCAGNAVCDAHWPLPF